MNRQSLFNIVAIACTFAAITANAEPYLGFANGQPIANFVPLTIMVYDEVSSALTAAPTVSVRMSGQTITVCIQRTLSGIGDPVLDGQFVPTPWYLPAGSYTVAYESSNRTADGVQPPCLPKASRPFEVLPLQSLVQVVEYYNADLDHYFMTADPRERNVLDGGAIPGWTQTGNFYTAFAPGTNSPDLSPVCRLYGLPQAGINSHFFSANPSDCTFALETWPNSWELETADAFRAEPLPPTGFCPPNLYTVTRMYNNKPDVNHRYVTLENTIWAMKARGWIEEGPVWCTSKLY